MAKILIDMDGVLCDYQTKFVEWRFKYPEIKFPQADIRFWQELEPMLGAIDAVRSIMKYHEVYFATAPSYLNAMCYTGKRMWIETYFGLEACKNLILCHDKSMLKGDVLIDDNLYTNGQDQFEGAVILHDNWEQTLKMLVLGQKAGK